MKIFKRIFIVLLILVTIGSISYGSILADSMYKKYNKTIEWKNSSLQSKIHMVPPSLAQNYVSGEEERFLALIADVNTALEEIKENKGIKEDKYEEYVSLQQTINAEIEKNEENKDLLKNNGFNDLTFYIEADSLLRNAYTALNVEDLEKLESTLASRVLKSGQEVDKVLLKKIQEVAKDFRNLENFSENAMGKLGVVENNILNVSLSVNEGITEELLKQIEEKKLRKFPHIEKLYGILISESWTNILAHNEDSKKYFAWKESKEILESLSKASYIPVSSFNTVEDVLLYSPEIKMSEKENHTINSTSIVKGVYYKGELLNENLYVKRGASLEFAIDYEYTENPKSIVTVEYLDNLGNKLNVDMFEDYVGKQIYIETELEGYVLVESENLLTRFPEENATITLMYEEYVPPVIIEEVEELPIEEPQDEVNVSEEEDSEEVENSDKVE